MARRGSWKGSFEPDGCADAIAAPEDCASGGPTKPCASKRLSVISQSSSCR
jgi:hypothetical protein